MNKALIFDWSGTLSDNFHCFCNVVNMMCNYYDREHISVEEIRKNFTIPYMKFWNQYFPDQSLLEHQNLYREFIQKAGEPKLFENVLETLQQLVEQDWKLFIVSSDPHEKFLVELARSELQPLITKAVCDVHGKSEDIQRLVSQFSLDEKHTYYIGDTSGDIEEGQKAGVKTIGVSWGFQDEDGLKKSNPTHLFHTLSQFSIFLQEDTQSL